MLSHDDARPNRCKCITCAMRVQYGRRTRAENRAPDATHGAVENGVPAGDRVVALEVVGQDPVRAAPRVRQRLDVLLRHVLGDPDRLEQLHAVILVREHLPVKYQIALSLRLYLALHVETQAPYKPVAHVIEGLPVPDVELRGPLAVPLA